LALVPFDNTNPPTTSICHNSIGVERSHRFHLRSRGRRASGLISDNRTNARYTPASDGNGSTPCRANSNTNRFGPHDGCARRNSATTTSTSAGI
jgi:hypothetical protein